jgi:protein SCO1/2
MLSRKTLLTLALMALLMAVGAGLGVYTNRYYHPETSAQSIPGLLWPNPKQLSEFTTIAHTGNTFGVNDLKGKWSLLFFGYTHCPDICPITLTLLGQIHADLQQHASPALQTIFVTVDPVRDTTERLAGYIGYFNPDFIALGGTQDQISRLTSQIGVASSHGAAGADGNYMVNHSTSILLIDPQARLAGIFSAPHDGETIIRQFADITDFISRQD